MNQHVTKEEFIAGYCARSGIDPAELLSVYRQVALPCFCGDSICQGWAMVGQDNVEDHIAIYGQPGQEPLP